MIADRIKKSIAVKQDILEDRELLLRIQQAADILIHAFRQGNKVLFCGNGGSAADAQHLAAELSGRFCFDRPPLPAEACHVNTSFLTAVANDYQYKQVFSRYVQSAAKAGDVLIGLSTSGNSENIVEAFSLAPSLKLHCIAFTGADGGKMNALSHLLLNVPSMETPRIQEAHILLGHIVCEIVEQTLFGHDK